MPCSPPSLTGPSRGNFEGMEKLNYLHQTSSGESYPLEIGFITLSCDKIPFNKNLTENACRSGCGLYGRNGGCPPFSTDFAKLQRKFKIANILYAKLETEYYPEKVLAGNYYVKWSFVEALLTPFTNRFSKVASDKKGRMFLSSGFCKGCGKKRCAVKEGRKCQQPLRKTFSLESTGVLVTEVTERFLGFKLYWWDRSNPRYFPPYMAKIVAILSNQPINNSDILSVLKG
jgi:predicted metal-binding protein